MDYYILEYIWIDGNNTIRSKTKVLYNDTNVSKLSSDLSQSKSDKNKIKKK